MKGPISLRVCIWPLFRKSVRKTWEFFLKMSCFSKYCNFQKAVTSKPLIRSTSSLAYFAQCISKNIFQGFPRKIKKNGRKRTPKFRQILLAYDVPLDFREIPENGRKIRKTKKKGFFNCFPKP